MGTNFYTYDGTHIGKRSGAGPYCWDCKITLCKEGQEKVHHGANVEWWDECPICHKPVLGETVLLANDMHGIRLCCSFTWAVDKQIILDISKWRWRPIRDEYGRRLSVKKFEEILAGCPIQFTHMIGEEFC